MKKFTILLACAIASTAQLSAQNTAKVWLDEFHINRGDDIVVHYSGGFGNEKDYVGIAPLGQKITGIPGGYTTTYAYLDVTGAKAGTATIPGHNMGATGDGYYWAVYLLNDGYDAASEYVPFYYGAEAPQNKAPELKLDECTDEYTTITFEDNALWRNLIKEIYVDETAISSDVYTFEDGTLYILEDLREANVVKITAWDHNDAIVQLQTSSIGELNTSCNIEFNSNLLQVTNNDALIQSVSVISFSGAVMETYQVAAGNHQFDLSHLEAGVYVIKATGKGVNKVIKVVIL